MTTIIDYGLGNIQAIVNVYKRLHLPVSVAQRAEDLLTAKQLILPGVGAFDHAMQRFEASGMRPAVTELVQAKKIPLLGICVGMQMLATSSDEGQCSGLGWVQGQVKSLNSLPMLSELPLPHMGWNDVNPVLGCPIFKNIEQDSRFYFLHSYYYQCQQPEKVAAQVNYDVDFCCAVWSENIYGVQFHPEKSHHYGATLLKNFSEL